MGVAPIVSGVLAAGVFLSATALSETALAQRTPKGAPVPFEVELSKNRRDRTFLSFNEHIANVPANRIKDLPVVNGRMGDRVTLGEGHTMHFPLGYLVTATYVIDKQRARSGATSASSPQDIEPNPVYALVQRFDAELGPVCARTEDKTNDVRAEFRQRPGQSMAVVLDTPGRYDSLTREKTRSYIVFVGTEERYVTTGSVAQQLLAHCKAGRTGPMPYDGKPLTAPALTGVGDN
jgi:hypothetical protein